MLVRYEGDLMFKYHYRLFLITLLFTSVAILSENQDGVHNYHPYHREAVYKIALSHVRGLVSFLAYKWHKSGVPETACNNQVMCFFDVPNLNQGKNHSKVYLKEGVPKGFINYSFKTPWYRALLNQQDGAVVKVHHMAVDNELRGQGIGTLLMDHVIEDCTNLSASKVELWSTFNNERFYHKTGFNQTHITRLAEVKFTKRLRPHPLLEGAL